jgi:hypothetical protein
VIAVPATQVTVVTEICARNGVKSATIGEVTAAAEGLTLDGLGTLDYLELDAAWRGTLPELFGA